VRRFGGVVTSQWCAAKERIALALAALRREKGKKRPRKKGDGEYVTKDFAGPDQELNRNRRTRKECRRHTVALRRPAPTKRNRPASNKEGEWLSCREDHGWMTSIPVCS